MATPPLSSSPVLATRSRIPSMTAADTIPPSSPPPFLSRSRTLKRSASSSSSIDSESPSSRPAKRRAIRAGISRRSASNGAIEEDATAADAAVPASSPPHSRPALKRTPSLLPAIDFQDSPPRPARCSQGPQLPSETNEERSLPSLEKKQKQKQKQDAHYPTPAPTSELGLLPSSPPRVTTTTTAAAAAAAPRQALRRVNSAISELRAPLSAVPTVTLPKEPTPVTFGRSANKCTYLLSKSHLVSRTHFKACYLPYGLRKHVEIHCVGFNGAKIHCKGEIWELRYGDKFWSETVGADIMLEIDDARVVLRWPSEGLSPTSPFSPLLRPVILDPKDFPYPAEFDVSKDVECIPSATEGVDKFLGFSGEPVPTLNKPSPKNGCMNAAAFVEPPPLRLSREPWSAFPESPCPLPKSNRLIGQSPINPFTSMTSQATFTLYEDDDDVVPTSEAHHLTSEDHGPVLRESQQPEANPEATTSGADDDSSDFDDEDINDSFENENSENAQDKINHSQPLSPLSSPTTTPTKKKYKVPELEESVKRDPLSPKSKQSIMKHLINQLAFSRLASTPLSILHRSLPVVMVDKVSVSFIQGLLQNIACVGEIKREGKDASGKALECEYYYIADFDEDEDRKEVVGSIQKPSLRACRKTHKQYFWKKPRLL